MTSQWKIKKPSFLGSKSHILQTSVECGSQVLSLKCKVQHSQKDYLLIVGKRTNLKTIESIAHKIAIFIAYTLSSSTELSNALSKSISANIHRNTNTVFAFPKMFALVSIWSASSSTLENCPRVSMRINKNTQSIGMCQKYAKYTSGIKYTSLSESGSSHFPICVSRLHHLAIIPSTPSLTTLSV